MKLVITLLSFVSAFGASPTQKLAGDFRDLDADRPTDVIIQYREGSADRLHEKLLARGGVLKHDFGVISARHYSLPSSAIRELADDPDVAYISPDRVVTGALEFAEPTVNANIALKYGYEGTGVGVAVIDSGISNAEDLKNSAGALRVVYQQDFVGGGTDDHYGHGQHVAGIVGGNGARSTGSQYIYTFRGIAPNANLINLRVLDQNGQGTDSTVIAAIQQAIALRTKYNVRIINLSLGRPIYESYAFDPLCRAVEQAWKAGIVVVVAAGNNGRDNTYGENGYGTITAPGNDPYVITVGAMKDMGTITRADDLIASYSSKGPTSIDHIVKPDLVAPGNHIISLLASTAHIESIAPGNATPKAFYIDNGDSSLSNDYFMLSGTSMATPMVSGAAALLLQQNAALTPDQVKARLMRTATKNFPASSVAVDPVSGNSYTSYYDIFTVGAGYLDCWAALNDTTVAAGNALSPTAVFNEGANTLAIQTTPGGISPTPLWASTSLWSTSMVWGSNVLWGSSTISGANVLWGSNALWGSNVLWGSNGLWGSNVLWGSGSVWATTSSMGAENLSITIHGE